MTAFQTFQKMKVDKALLLLEPFDPNNSCFCYSTGRSSLASFRISVRQSLPATRKAAQTLMSTHWQGALKIFSA